MTNPNDLLNHNLYPALSGAEITKLMRRERVTIKQLAQTMGIAQQRVRWIRQHGKPAGLASWEIHHGIWEAAH